ncbi:hypothetical protein OQJ02_08615 [Legionella sp. PATHC032]|uniref:hypothetical protein n=1 Tax=Legionella sp. PATHC032 TaxID=2992039 RepID=UPI001B1D435E|nr:hypothetical protein [Legionella sp. PATHC032]MCW8421700.1 hypothetical protein [Legionella sp. PATHC032]HAZ7571775.1 hypothetical protein [Legionella pneumophila]HBA1633715.1 hypothetical protein [Legionella pneumophila]
MLRHSLIYLLLSILIVVFAKYAHLIVVYIDMFFTYVNLKLTPIFSQTGWGLIIRKILVLMLLPIIIAGIPALIYRVLKGKDMPHFIAIVWIIWTIIVLSDILIR